jgi:hypothetical protein
LSISAEKVIKREKGRFDNQRVQVALILNRANSLEYHGDDFQEAIDVIVAGRYEADEDKVHDRLME